MNKIITPNDFGIVSNSDSLSIQKAVNFAKDQGINRVVIPRMNKRTGKPRWEIDKSILLPSNMTVILDNCYMILADNSYCNFFRNEYCGTERAKSIDGEQHDIHIIGEGYPILDGGKTNLLLECTARKFDSATTEGLGIRINNAILFHNVRDFSIENIEIRNHRWWAINLMYCRNGRISDYTCMATNLIQNQDGLNLRCGCNNIVIERLTGKSGDDLIALTALARSDNGYHVDGKDSHIHDIVIKDVIGCSIINTLVAFRNHDGRKIYNVEMENIIQSDLEDLNNHPYATINVGQNDYIRIKPSSMGDTRNINATTVMSENATTLLFAATLQDCKFRNIHAIGGKYAISSFGVKMENIKFQGVYVGEKKTELPLRFVREPFSGNDIEFSAYARNEDFLDNVTFDDVQCENREVKFAFNKENKNDIYVEGKRYE